jgi:ribonucleoside-diphosphate reductase subunit M1
MKNMIIAHNGSIQNIPEIPDNVKAIYKTVWEISQKKVLDLAADRGAYICQSQSLNVHLQAPTLGQLTSMHFYGWKKGLKTGMYYLRTRPAAQAIQFTVDQNVLKDAKTQQTKATDIRKTEIVTGKGTGIPTPTSSSSSSPVRSAVTSNKPSTNNSASVIIKQEPATPSLRFSPPPTPAATSAEQAGKPAEPNPEFAAAVQRQKERELQEAKLLCSIENKEACLMCSG